MRGTKVNTEGVGPSPAVRARILKALRRGDQRLIAEVVGTRADYVKQLMRYRTESTSPLALRVWKAADRILKDRQRLTQDLSR